MNGILCVDGWAGRRETPVQIVAQQVGKRKSRNIKVKLLKDCRLPNRMAHEGEVIIVPRDAVRMEEKK